MKKLMLFICCLLATSNFLLAQKVIQANKLKKPTSNKVIKTTLPQVTTSIEVAPNIVVYERPNFQGRSAKFIKNEQGKFEFPFPVKRVSIRIPSSMVLYIQRCSEFRSENAYKSNIGDINLENICGVRSDHVVLVRVSIAGISTEIHNKDCMRFAGKIEAKLIETTPFVDGVQAVVPGVYYKEPQRNSPTRYTLTLFDMGTTPNTDRKHDPSKTRNKIIYNNNPVPVLTTVNENLTDSFVFNRPSHYYSNSPFATFHVGKSAIAEGRVKLMLKTDLVSAHKTCDLCDDFSSKIKMERPVSDFFLLKKSYSGGKIIDAAHTYIVAGPYEATGIRDGDAYTATNGTIKHFRVHLIIEGL